VQDVPATVAGQVAGDDGCRDDWWSDPRREDNLDGEDRFGRIVIVIVA
jgi:hypothetical protein